MWFHLTGEGLKKALGLGLIPVILRFWGEHKRIGPNGADWKMTWLGWEKDRGCRKTVGIPRGAEGLPPSKP